MPAHWGLGGGGLDREKGGVYINGGRQAFTIPRSASASAVSYLQPRETAAMTFNGTWKVDRSENYDKFMEQMGECARGVGQNTHAVLQKFLLLGSSGLIYQNNACNCASTQCDIAV